ncbi:MAG TPA: hypothetical protein RMG48_05120 [Myxococcales bacterium LLY-WYZ-16_1]|nr:hypothetical protein [Myxococcales bacterium LLY-WYZ-16_1]
MKLVFSRNYIGLLCGFIVCLSSSFGCGGGPDGIRLIIADTITDVTILGDGTARGDIREISTLDAVSPQEVSVSAGFGDGDEIADQAVISSENGQLIVDLRGVGDRLDRGFRFAIAVRAPSRVRIDRVDSVNLRMESQGEGIESLDLSSTRISLVKPRSTDADLQIQADDSAVDGRLVLRRLELDAVNSELSIRGLSDFFSLTMSTGTLSSRSVGGRQETVVDGIDSDIRGICGPGDLIVRAREGTSVSLDPSCSPDNLSVDADATSRVR